MPSIVTLTLNPTVDASTEVGRVTANEKLRCESMRYEPGGGGINVARVVARLGLDVTAVFLAGGATGRQLRELLEDETGIDALPVDIDGSTRLNVHVDEHESGDQYRFVMPGPEVTAEEYETAVDAALQTSPDILVASGSLPPGVSDDALAEVAKRTRETPTRLIVDTSGPALEAVAGAGVYLLKPNATELRDLWGGDLEDDDLEAAARRLAERGAADVIVLSLGSGGAYLATSDGGRHLRAPTVPIESRVGAGDSMVAGIAVGLVRGWEVTDAVRLGLAAGAAAVMTPGTELARADDIERLYRRGTD
ncbi:MAG: 1-phosphofructokinase family hexose kinase [Actinobacteria bacterium]|nr:1-phosphofructokinase family hexose kinase [Actinomycetota bacterium]